MKAEDKINKIIKKDKQLFMTTTRQSYNFVAEKGEGDFAYDITGRKFIDFSSFISVYNLGINSSLNVKNAMKRQDRQAHARRVY